VREYDIVMIGLLGVDHQRANVELRGRLTFGGEHLTAALRTLRREPAIREAIVLSTCNRTEVYVATDEWEASRATILAFLAAVYAADGAAVPVSPLAGEVVQGTVAIPAPGAVGADLPPELCAALYERKQHEVARHLFRVAAGLESMVVGEPQILGQVKDALAAAEAAGTVGDQLRAAFVGAIKAGKRVRTQTAIGRVDDSLPALAVRVAAEALDGLRDQSVLVIGAGKTSQLTARLLRAEGIGRLVLANRSLPAARALAEELGGEAISLEALASELARVRLVVSATAAPYTVLSAATVAAGVAASQRPLVIVDLAVPADIETAAGQVPGVSLYTLDSLRALHASGEDRLDATAGHRDAIFEAEQLLAEAERDFVRGQTLRQVVPGIAALRRHVDRSEHAEVSRALAQLAHLSEDDQAVVERLGQRLVDKMFHHLVSRIRSLAEYDEVPPHITMQVLARLLADPDAPAEGE
jgi:glutamyl-tRNA reductase